MKTLKTTLCLIVVMCLLPAMLLAQDTAVSFKLIGGRTHETVALPDVKEKHVKARAMAWHKILEKNSASKISGFSTYNYGASFSYAIDTIKTTIPRYQRKGLGEASFLFFLSWEDGKYKYEFKLIKHTAGESGAPYVSMYSLEENVKNQKIQAEIHQAIEKECVQLITSLKAAMLIPTEEEKAEAAKPKPKPPVYDFNFPELDGKYHFEQVGEVQGISQDILFERAKGWAFKHFVSMKNAEQNSDKASGTLTFKTNTGVLYSKDGEYIDMGRVEFRMAVYCKEGRYKYVFSDFHHLPPADLKSEFGGPLESLRSYSLPVADIKQQTYDIATQLIESLKKAMATKAVSEF